MNIVQLYDYIGQVAKTIPLVHSYSNQTPYEFWNTDSVKYGSVIFAVKSASVRNNVVSYECIIYYGDRLNDSGLNRESVQTDAVNVIESITSFLNCSDRIEFVTQPINCTLFEQQFADNLAGAYANIVIETEAGVGCCDYNLLDEFYTKGQINEMLKNIDLDDYYTKSQIDEKLENIDLEDYYTKSQVDKNIQDLAHYMIGELNDINKQFSSIDKILESLLEDVDVTAIEESLNQILNDK